MDIEDDSDNDSDYRPDDDADGIDVSSNGGNQSEKKLVTFSAKTKRTVDQLWRSMQDEDRRYVQLKMGSSLHPLRHGPKDNISIIRHNFEVLKDIFGSTVAKQITVASSYDVIPSDDDNRYNSSAENGSILVTSNNEADGSCGTAELRKRALESVEKVVKKRKVTETRKFAGKEIKIERNVLLSSSEAQDLTVKKDQSNGGAAPRGIDQVLDTIKGPKAVSTVAKSSMDWDIYKEKEGLDEDLSAAAKDGFLTRQDFLQRCDVRAYEVDKTARLINSAGGGNTGQS